MIKTTIALLVLAVLAGVIGFTGDRGALVGVARVVFFLSLLFVLVGLIMRRPSHSA